MKEDEIPEEVQLPLPGQSREPSVEELMDMLPNDTTGVTDAIADEEKPPFNKEDAEGAEPFNEEELDEIETNYDALEEEEIINNEIEDMNEEKEF